MNNDKSMVFLRQATIMDIEFLAQVCESNTVLYDSIMPGAFKKQADKFRDKGINTGYDVDIIKKDGKSVGFTGTLELAKNRLYLVALYLYHEVQRQGIGFETLNQIIEKAKESENTEILLLVHSEASWAISFYKKYGFSVVGESESEIKQYGSGAVKSLYLTNAYLMSLKID